MLWSMTAQSNASRRSQPALRSPRPDASGSMSIARDVAYPGLRARGVAMGGHPWFGAVSVDTHAVDRARAAVNRTGAEPNRAIADRGTRAVGSTPVSRGGAIRHPLHKG